jgi:hypothetical protein
MPTQYVRVLFPEMRAVLVDDTESGQTNQVLMIEQGTHKFSLGGEPDYAPSFLEQVITGTTPAGPLELHFNPVSTRASTAATAAGVATVAAGVAVLAAGVAAGAAAIASSAASDAEHEAADAAFDAANADASHAPSAEEMRTDSDAGKPTT